MTVKEYQAINGLKCKICKTKKDVTYDEDGDEICFDCLFERDCDIDEKPKYEED